MSAGLGSAGISTASLGVLDGDLNNLFSNEGGVAGINNDFSHNMQLYAAAGKRKRSDNWLRPDYHLESDKKFEDMSLCELFYGMQGVYEMLIEKDIPELPASSYLDHMRFVKLKSQSGAFSAKQLARYDYKVVTRVIDRKLPCFVGGDNRSVEAHLSAEHMQHVGATSQSLPANNQGGARKRSRRGGGGAPRFERPDERDREFTNICLNWNFTSCNYENCSRRHVCKHCQADHKGKNCSLDRDNQSQPQRQAQA